MKQEKAPRAQRHKSTDSEGVSKQRGLCWISPKSIRGAVTGAFWHVSTQEHMEEAEAVLTRACLVTWL